MKQQITKLSLKDYFTFTGAFIRPALVGALKCHRYWLAPDPHNAMNEYFDMNKVVELYGGWANP